MDDISFIQDIFLKVSGGHEHILMGEDFNFCSDPILYKSESASTTLSFMKDLYLTDVWRQIHPQTIYYSYYSNRHNPFTRMALFLLSTHVAYRALGSDYLLRILSDHSPLTLSIVMPDKIPNMYRCWDGKRLSTT